MAREFDTTLHKASVAKKVVAEKGILAEPNPKKGRRLDSDIVNKVKEFYLSEEISRTMPGKKDTVSVSVNGERKSLQKHLILCNLTEAYAKFKEKYPEMKIGFSKFAELRPKQCVLPGASGTHSVCVCQIHQNMKLMFVGSNLDKLTTDDDYPLKSVQDCVIKLQCNPPSISCCLGECFQCGNDEALKEQIQNAFENNFIDMITFKRWTNTDRSNLETVVKGTDDFVLDFLNILRYYQKHAFLTKMQSNSYKDCKENLIEGEVLVVMDFAENYSFVVQDEVQSFHWNNDMVTLHPFVAYYKDNGKLENLNFVVVSECNIHDTVSVHLFLKFFHLFLKSKLPGTHKIIYFSDGCAAQYKNCKKFLNLCHHEEDFKTKAEWNFFTTSHGKGPCDGLGGTVKRLATRASLQRPYSDQILTPQAFFKFCEENIENIKFQFATNSDYGEEERLLHVRLVRANTIAGTQKMHYFQPVTKYSLLVKQFSLSEISSIKRVSDSVQLLPDEEILGYVTVTYERDWWLGYVLDRNTDLRQATIKFLQPKGPSGSFTYPSRPDILIVPFVDVLTSVEVTTTNARKYSFPKREQEKASKVLEQIIVS